ncbi:MAG: hypothetical protein D5R96_00870 [Methanocalculus sp. MSAO_Arc2]|uniref:hypothetical protein n=1 Tax=Methanocalculus sp. MSAO_Arc2 TaxID=2293855 RepID=UPI000FEF2D3E|nr:MAG: hypothetical protein D5R96_00870 [Methanocalculus sp. MSAO_Arc2]
MKDSLRPFLLLELIEVIYPSTRYAGYRIEMTANVMSLDPQNHLVFMIKGRTKSTIYQITGS